MADAAPDKSNSPPRPVPARPVHRSRAVRLWAALLLVGCAALVVIAAYLRPDTRGFGTHAQLGAGPCGFLVMTGYPCPTCGMTTAFAHTIRGQWWRALTAQPAGFVLAVGVLAAMLVSAFTVVAGRWPRVRVPLASPFRLFAALLVLLVGSWVFKIVSGLVAGTLPYR